MDSAELIERLRREAGFRLLPLLGNTGQVAGAHLARFLPGGRLDVVQVWDERWAAWARLPSTLDAAPSHVTSGPFAAVVAPLLPLQPGIIRHGIVQHGLTAP